VPLWFISFEVGVAFGQEPGKGYAKEYYHSFKGDSNQPKDVGLMGPNNDRCIKFEPEGMRITLPTGYVGSRPSTGVATKFGVRGDFEITMGYEVLQEPDSARAGSQTRLTLGINLDKINPFQNQASISRRVMIGKLPHHSVYMSECGEDPIRMQTKSDSFVLGEKSGRLRLVRAGAEMSYYVAEGAESEFKLLKTYTHSAEDVRGVTIVGSTGGDQAALDVRVIDLRIKAADLPTPGPIKSPSLTPPPADYAKEYFHSFKGNPARPAGWEFEGPEAEQCTSFDAAGMRINLPLGWKGARKATGIKSTFGAKGDCEITLGYEILAEPNATTTGNGTRLSLGIWKETPRPNVATVNRSVGAKVGTVHVTWQSLWDDEIGSPKMRGNDFPAKDKIGRLRFVRHGPHLYFGFSDGLDGEFRFKAKYDFGAEELREVRIVAATGGEQAAFDVRVFEVRIRSEGSAKAADGAPAPVPIEIKGIAPPAAPPSRSWLMAGALIGGMIVLLLLCALVVGFLVVRRKEPAPSATQPVRKKG
jgi:hypothetical protein